MTLHVTPLLSNTPSHRLGEKNGGCHECCHNFTYNSIVLIYTKQGYTNGENNGVAMTSHITPLLSNSPSHRHGENNESVIMTSHITPLLSNSPSHRHGENNECVIMTSYITPLFSGTPNKDIQTVRTIGLP